MGVFVIVGVFVAIALVITIANAKEIKNKKAKAEAEKAKQVLDEKDEFKKFLDYDSTSPSGSPQRTPKQPISTPASQRPVQNTAQYRSPSTQRISADLQQRYEETKRNQAQQKQAAGKNIVASSHHDSHCDVSHKDKNDRYRVEYVPTMNSIGGKSTEGCQDHYNVRYVKLESESAKVKELTPLQKTIVYGEVINEPAFKRGYRGRR